MSEQPLLSQSPNPRPKITVPAESWPVEALHHLVGEYNAMIDEIEHLSAHIVHLGDRPSNALPGETATTPEHQAPATVVPADIPQQVGPDIPVPADGTPSAAGTASNPAHPLPAASATQITDNDAAAAEATSFEHSGRCEDVDHPQGFAPEDA